MSEVQATAKHYSRLRDSQWGRTKTLAWSDPVLAYVRHGHHWPADKTRWTAAHLLPVVGVVAVRP